METNKVFQLVEYLYYIEKMSKEEREEKKIASFTSYKRVIEKVNRLGNEAYSLKPKSPLSDDTLYNRKQKELDEYVAYSKIHEFLEKHKNKISELGFTLGSGIYKSEFQNIITVWLNNITDKVEARKQLAECKRQYNELQTEEVQFVLKWMSNLFFDGLNYDLKIIFDEHLGKKYNDLSNDLKPYLERFDADVIESIIDNKRLPQGAEKPIWKHQADAIKFKERFRIHTKDMNKMFLYRNRKGDIIEKLKDNRKSNSPEFSNVLSKYH